MKGNRMSGDRNYSKATEAALFAISTKCYYPKCTVPSVSIFGDGAAKNVQIAHIVAVSPSGPRYQAMPREKFGSFENLILLCALHHPRVDRKANEHIYTAEVLSQWKWENEKDIRAKIDGLDRLTEGRVDEMLTTAVDSTKHEIMAALGDLKRVSVGAAELLRVLLDKIEKDYIDSDSIALLYAASERLGSLEDDSARLFAASSQLEDLEENASLLQDAAEKLASLNEGALSERVEQIVEDCVRRIRNEFDEIPDISGSVEAAHRSVVSEIEQRLGSIDMGDPVTVVDDEQRWKFGLIGYALGVLTVFVTIAILALNGAI